MKGTAGRGCTRRAVLSGFTSLALPAAENKNRLFPSERARFSDSTTEFEVTRLTSPSCSSFLPVYYGRAVSRHGDFLLYSCDRTGSLEAYRLDWRTGESRLLTHARQLEASSLWLMPDDRSFCYFDGQTLRQTILLSLRTRDIYRAPEGWQPGAGFAVAGDAVHAVCIEKKDATTRLRLIGMSKGDASTVVETTDELSSPQPRPKRAGILYRRDGGLWLVHYDGQQNRRLKTAPGRIGPAMWSADGAAVLYLHYPDEPRALNAIREHVPDTNTDRLIAPTSQFVHFGRNGDASVFVGASGSKAAPYILILLRVTRRELTLCEHRASDPASVAPVFSPDSQRIFFQSDRDGKPAIYALNVDRLVEKTDT